MFRVSTQTPIISIAFIVACAFRRVRPIACSGTETDSPRGRIYLMRAFAEGRTTITDTFVRAHVHLSGLSSLRNRLPLGGPFRKHDGRDAGAYRAIERAPNFISQNCSQTRLPLPGSVSHRGAPVATVSEVGNVPNS